MTLPTELSTVAFMGVATLVLGALAVMWTTKKGLGLVRV